MKKKKLRKRSVKYTAIALYKPKLKKPLDMCQNCGNPGYAAWNNPKTQKRYVWCTKKSCEKTIKKNIPSYVTSHYTVSNRKANIPFVFTHNEIELTNSAGGKDKITGYSAQLCHDAWKYSIAKTDIDAVEKLFKIRPNARFLLFNEDGKLRVFFKNREDAEDRCKVNEVLVFWSGN